ncbi:hypothetical protein TCAL_05424 [Tigriopus californicus]|uniref:CCDC92/74 N-terminal domain-containing protein n=2 Tax=Tigriopus californicus TaxID=6832 RepID=A0A553NX81_TIGCA|nr:hypothetical protein TCAL_05424 [Tigriopus californicus]
MMRTDDIALFDLKIWDEPYSPMDGPHHASYHTEKIPDIRKSTVLRDEEELSTVSLVASHLSTNQIVVSKDGAHKSQASSDELKEEHGEKLEKQIIFLKQEHQNMLRALQIEVDLLKQKNKDLHFHIVMQNLSSKLSESCEELKDVRVVQGSSHHMENLEGKIKALSVELHEVQSRNLYLSSIIEEQKQKLLEFETKTTPSTLIHSPISTAFRTSARWTKNSDHENGPGTEEVVSGDDDDLEEDEELEEHEDLSLSLPSTPTIPTPSPPQEYLQKLREANMLIESLKNENQVQRREILEIKSTIDKGTKLRFKGCNHPTRLLSRAQRQPKMDHASAMSSIRPAQGTWGPTSSANLPRRGSRTQIKDVLPPLDNAEKPSKRNAIYLPSELPPVSTNGGNYHHSHSQFPLNLVSFPDSQNTRDHHDTCPSDHLDTARKKRDFPSLRSKSVTRALNTNDLPRRNSTNKKALRNVK